MDEQFWLLEKIVLIRCLAGLFGLFWSGLFELRESSSQPLNSSETDIKRSKGAENG